jgi:hypothetical protein
LETNNRPEPTNNKVSGSEEVIASTADQTFAPLAVMTPITRRKTHVKMKIRAFNVASSRRSAQFPVTSPHPDFSMGEEASSRFEFKRF